MSPSYRKRKRERLLARSRKGVAARAVKWAARTAGLPIRQDRVVEIVIRDSHRPLTIIRLRREDQGERWGRWRGIGSVPLGPTGIGTIIGKYLE